MVGQTFDVGVTIGYSCKEGYALQKDLNDPNFGFICVKTIPGNLCEDNIGINKKYHFKGIYDDRFEARIERYSSKAIYYQKWQLSDIIHLQFLSVGYGALTLQIFDCMQNQIALIPSTIVADRSVQNPYIKQHISVDLSIYGTGIYQFVISANNKYLLISEWQQVSSDLPETALIEYYHSRNKPDAYFKEWRPAMRVETFFAKPTPESISENYEDEPGDSEIIHSDEYLKQKMVFGDGYGLPDFMLKK